MDPQVGDEPATDCGDDCTTIFWLKIAGIVVFFVQGVIAGMYPTWSESCRSNPKILGVANSFACGVFIAIALVHILPEEIEGWAGYCGDPEELFPLPELLAFVGYTLILVLDKVMFDSHALFDEHDDGHLHDPADRKL